MFKLKIISIVISLTILCSIPGLTTVKVSAAGVRLVNDGVSGTVDFGAITENTKAAETTVAEEEISLIDHYSTGFDIYAKNGTSSSFSIRDMYLKNGIRDAYIRAVGVASAEKPVEYMEFRANKGVFDLESILLGSYDINHEDYKFTLQALDSSYNLTGAAATLSGVANTFGSLSVAGNPDFDDIYGFRITVNQGAQICVDDIAVSDPKEVPSDEPPVASNVMITGTLQVGETLMGCYDYKDVNGDAEGASIFQWYRSEDSSGSGKSVIEGATAAIYELQAEDEGKCISFEVTPVAAVEGIMIGTAVESAVTDAVEPAGIQGLRLVRNGLAGTVTFDSSAVNNTRVAITDSADGIIHVTDYLGTGLDIYAKNGTSSIFSIRGMFSKDGFNDGYVRAVGVENAEKPVEYMEFRANKGVFDLESLSVGSYDIIHAEYTFTLQALDRSYNVTGSAITFSDIPNSTFETLDVTGNLDFNDIYGFRITVDQGAQICVDNITISDPKVQTEEIPVAASGLTVEVAAKTIPEKGKVVLSVTPSAITPGSQLYFRKTITEPAPLYVGDTITINCWTKLDSYIQEISADNGTYIEVAEISSTDNTITQWGKSAKTDDGLSDWNLTPE